MEVRARGVAVAARAACVVSCRACCWRDPREHMSRARQGVRNTLRCAQPPFGRAAHHTHAHAPTAHQWLNRLLEEVWPYYDRGVCRMVKEIVEPIMEQYRWGVACEGGVKCDVDVSRSVS
jgi:hypothetical protein